MIAPLRKTDPGPAFDWLMYESLCKTGKPLCFPYV